MNLKLDLSDDSSSIWAATTNTYVNKWAVDPSTVTNGKMEEGEERNMEEEEEEEEEEEVAITDIDDPQPMFTQPLATIPGQPHSPGNVLFHIKSIIICHNTIGINLSGN